MLELFTLELETRLLLLFILLEDTGAGEELLNTTVTLLAIAEDEITACELEVSAAAEEDARPREELEGILAPAWLLEIAARLLDLSDELLAEDFTEDSVWPEDWLLPVPGMPPPPPQAVKATDKDTAERTRKE